jgi:hypothetical protein
MSHLFFPNPSHIYLMLLNSPYTSVPNLLFTWEVRPPFFGPFSSLLHVYMAVKQYLLLRRSPHLSGSTCRTARGCRLAIGARCPISDRCTPAAGLMLGCSCSLLPPSWLDLELFSHHLWTGTDSDCKNPMQYSFQRQCWYPYSF